MKIKAPFIGILAFIIVLLTMPLGHVLMIVMEKILGHNHLFQLAFSLGLLGLFILIWGMYSSNKENKATFLGLFAGLFIWTGWIEFSFVYYANRFGVAPLVENGVVVTKPEYLIMPASIGFWAVFMIYYFFGTKTGCHFFNWFQKKLNLSENMPLTPIKRSPAMTTFMELITLLWTFYLVLLFAYDKEFLGDRHWGTHIIAFGSLIWAIILFPRIFRIKQMAYAVRYSIPVVIIFWNFVEILGRWNIFKEIWIHPQVYKTEIIITSLIFLGLVIIAIIKGERKKKKI